MIALNTDGSQETIVENLNSNFCAKIILVNHEKRFPVDVICSNLAIKYNMLYLSVSQLIKKQIDDSTSWGKLLVASRKNKSLADSCADEQFLPVHFDQELVIKLIQHTVAEKRTNQSYIILEGLCNNKALGKEDDKLALRYMDELFQIEKHLGEVSAVISLQEEAESDRFADDKWEEFEEPVKEEPKPKQLDDDGNPIDEEEAEPAAEDDGEPKKPKWNPAEYKWTITNRRFKNLPQLFRDYKGINCLSEAKNAKEAFGGSIVKALDEFCGRVVEDTDNRSYYQQVVFDKEVQKEE